VHWAMTITMTRRGEAIAAITLAVRAGLHIDSRPKNQPGSSHGRRSLVSLDGVHGDPQSWAGDYFDEQAAAESLAVLLDSDAMLMGRNTYEYLAPAWSSPSGSYLERINEMHKYVFSSTLTAGDWNNTTIIPGDPVAAVRELRLRRGTGRFAGTRAGSRG